MKQPNVPQVDGLADVETLLFESEVMELVVSAHNTVVGVDDRDRVVPGSPVVEFDEGAPDLDAVLSGCLDGPPRDRSVSGPLSHLSGSSVRPHRGEVLYEADGVRLVLTRVADEFLRAH